MNIVPALNFQDFVMQAGDKLVTDSRKVAKAFGKRHGNVLRAVDAMRDSDIAEIRSHYRLNFESVEAPDGKGQLRRTYRMTKDGLSELAMSFTGDQARLVRIRFIAAFNEMAEQLQRRDKNLWQQMQALISKEVESKVRASFGSQLMLERKREIPGFDDERSRLESQIQPSLLTH